jgi:mannitol-1-phosphate 5-dehydrogenase
VLRVVRDPIRKLSPRERLVAPAMMAAEYGLAFEWIVKGIVAALKYEHPADQQATRLQSIIRHDGVGRVLQEVCQIPKDSALNDTILRVWNE